MAVCDDVFIREQLLAVEKVLSRCEVTAVKPKSGGGFKVDIKPTGEEAGASRAKALRCRYVTESACAWSYYSVSAGSNSGIPGCTIFG